MQYYYCIFCQTCKCKTVATLLEARGVGRAFSPQVIKRQRKSDKNVELLFDFLPGYVFVFTCNPVKATSLLKVDGVIRLIGYPEYGHCLQGEDKSFALGLLERNGLVDAIKILRTGYRVKVENNLFSGCEGKVAKIDYRKQRAKVLFDFAGVSCSSWVACNFIEIKCDEF